MTEVFVVVLAKDGYEEMVGTTNPVEFGLGPESHDAQRVRLVMRKRHEQSSFVMVYLNDEKADAVFQEELDDLIRRGYAVLGEPQIIDMKCHPWNGEQSQIWADAVFIQAGENVTVRGRLTTYLRSRGWIPPEKPGTLGGIWHFPGNPMQLPIPNELVMGGVDWQRIMERLAIIESTSIMDLEKRIRPTVLL